MTRKHFNAIAEDLRLTVASYETCRAIADTCARYNPNFNRFRFMEACGHDGT